MNNNSYKNFSISLLFILCFAINAKAQDKLVLKEVLEALESDYDHTFSYADEVIANYRVFPPATSSTFEQALAAITAQTGLQFEILQDRIVTISQVSEVNRGRCGRLLLEDGTPLQGAVVRSPREHTVTDHNGYFRLLTSEDRDTLSITHLGYRTLHLVANNLDSAGCSPVIMNSKVELLSEITLYNFLTRGIDILADGSIRINATNFGILPGLTQADPLQAVQTLPGINSNDETVTNINIRGGSHDQNYISWNGIRMYQSGHFFSYISAFNPDLVHETTLIRNGTSAQYGGGVSGSILMNSDQKIDSTLSGSAGLNLVNAMATLSVPLGKKAALRVAGRRSLNELFRSQAYQNYFNQAFQNTEVITNSENVIAASDEFRFYDVGGVLNYHLSGRQRIKAGFLLMKNNFSFLENAFVNNVEQSRLSSSEQENRSVFIQYQKWWEQGLSLQLHSYWLNYRIEGRNADILRDQLLIQQNDIEEVGFKVSTGIRLNNALHLLSGYEVLHTGVINLDALQSIRTLNSEERELTRHALFTEAKWTPWKGAELRSGIRFSYFAQADQLSVEPRVNLVHDLGEKSTLNLAAEIKTQSITQEVDLQTDFLGVENRRWFLADNELRPVVMNRQVSLGYMYKNNHWSFHTEGYLKKVESINARSQEFTNNFERIYALGDYTSEGIDVTVNYGARGFSGWLNYSLSNTHYDFPALYPELFPSNFRIRHAMTSGVSYKIKGFNIALGYNSRTGLPTTLPVAGNEVVNNEINYEAPNSSELPYYSRLDGSVTYDLKLPPGMNLRLGAAVWNMFNEENEINRFYRFTDINYPQRASEFSLERTLNVFLKLDF